MTMESKRAVIYARYSSSRQREESIERQIEICNDYAAAHNLVENYAVKVDPVLHAEVLERYKKLNLAPYKGFVNPVYELVTDKDGNITDVTVSYDEDYVEQMLRYSKDYSPLPSVNN